MSELPRVPPSHVASETELQLGRVRTGPLALTERYRERSATACCVLCGRTMLRRQLYESPRLGRRCIDRSDCLASSDVEPNEPVDELTWRHDLGLRRLVAAEVLYGRGRQSARPSVVLSARNLDSGAVVNRCSCGTAITAAEWEALPQVGAKEVEDGDLVIFEDYRNHTCGSTRMIFHERVRRR